MYSDMMRRMQQKDVDKKKTEDKAAIARAADAEVPLSLSLLSRPSPPLDQKSASAPSLDPEELERIRKRQAGHPVTLEAFMEWKVKFEAEMMSLKIAQHGPVDKDREDKPTGKQLFLSNRAGLEEALIAAGEQETSAQLAAAMSAATRRAAAGEGSGEGEQEEGGIAVKEDLFMEDYDDEDLDDMLDDDEEEDEDYDGESGEEDEDEEDV
jgi:hypothetical protein